ncbi:MalY/PatB family protein [Ralstonia solanacearum]|uniref:MalY/PatB family protein n=1 Tax=Ralstonia solanacearum TaxID=305 RepID=UPI0005ABF257|nr:PatB family C-S lyase [Ralstonia solanacearum]AMP75741.1 aminotransferase [Ralstonia solanacearum]MCL9824269.1 PatB family C-S lyase [Ralstonia solanacearum]MCL9829488.1 PatB family C-S lyase [Ralstonia solanacearum]MCL9834269.1 PatB family C-S lyase [Ralstonia solanacearum]OAI73214.1 aminotransferase [Ralstonia solanacearum]
MSDDFDRLISRRGTNALAEEGFENYLFGAGVPAPELNVPREELISMWVADMQFAAPDAAIDAISERLKYPILGYTMNLDDQLYQAFHPWCIERYDWRFSREEMQVSLGVIPALFGLVEYICQPGDKVLSLTPAYGYFKHATSQRDRVFVTSRLLASKDGDYTIDFEDFEAKISDPAVKLFFLCHPHNPTGRVWTNDELRRLGELCFANGVKIVSDEIHCDLLRAGVRHTPLAKLFPDSKDIITCMAVSKTFNLAGMMIATVIIPDPELRAEWKRRHYPFVNPLSLAAAIGAYTNGAPWLDALRLYLDGNFVWVKHFLETHLPKAGFRIPDATYLAWIDLGAYFDDSVNLTRFFLEKAGVILEGGEMFVENGSCRMRLNLACPRAQVQRSLEKIRDAITSHYEVRR